MQVLNLDEASRHLVEAGPSDTSPQPSAVDHISLNGTGRCMIVHMAKWATPLYSKGAIDRAGASLTLKTLPPEEEARHRAVINNWRSSHGFPLNTLTASLLSKARAVDPESLVARRTKRLTSIRLKLQRFPDMKLSRMHDLGGARAVMSTVEQVRDVERKFTRSKHKHELARHDDYINNPQESGYRGIHLVYKYKSDRSKTYSNLRIEVQLRSRLMHSWATAVETVGTFTKQSLKSSSGDIDFLRFFSLMSAYFANEEGQPFPPGVPADMKELRGEIKDIAKRQKIVERLEAYRQGLKHTEDDTSGGKYVLLQLDIVNSALSIRTFTDPGEATEAFDAVEADSNGEIDDPDQDAVLVTVESVASLRSAFPNYFLDTSDFLYRLRQIAQ